MLRLAKIWTCCIVICTAYSICPRVSTPGRCCRRQFNTLLDFSVKYSDGPPCGSYGDARPCPKAWLNPSVISLRRRGSNTNKHTFPSTHLSLPLQGAALIIPSAQHL